MKQLLSWLNKKLTLWQSILLVLITAIITFLIAMSIALAAGFA